MCKLRDKWEIDLKIGNTERLSITKIQKSFGPHWGFFLEGQFLEILKLKNPQKIASPLSNAIKFLKKM